MKGAPFTAYQRPVGVLSAPASAPLKERVRACNSADATPIPSMLGALSGAPSCQHRHRPHPAPARQRAHPRTALTSGYHVSFLPGLLAALAALLSVPAAVPPPPPREPLYRLDGTVRRPVLGLRHAGDM